MTTNYTHAQHTVYHHHYHIVWITKYRYKVLQGTLRLRIREIIAQVADEMNIKIINGVLSSDHIHVFVSIPPHITVSEFVQKSKGRSSRKIQQEFPDIKKRYWGRHFGVEDTLVLELPSNFVYSIIRQPYHFYC